MEFTAWIDVLIEELPLLWESVKLHAFPDSFLTRALGFSSERIAQLPDYLLYFVGLYLACGLITVVLRFKRNQRSINSLAKQIVNIILTSCCILIIPLVPMLAKACVHVLQNEVPAYQGLSDLGRYIADCFGSIIYLLMALGGLICTAWLPIGGALTYLKRYKLCGLPHMIFDYGTGLFLICLYLLATWHGKLAFYALILPAVVMLRLIQIGGYLPEEVNSYAAVTGGETKKYEAN